jgi:Leucine-rich repeat (LRR) protein
MSDQDNCNQSLVAGGRSDLVPVVSENPLVARGLVDIARVSGSIRAVAFPPSPLKLEIAIAGKLSVRAVTGGLRMALTRTPALVDLGPTKLAEVKELLVESHERALAHGRHRFEKLRLLDVCEDRLNSLKTLGNSQDDYVFSFEADSRRPPYDVRCSQTDQAVASILAIKQLDMLDLHDCSVTDKGLEHLRGHPGLTELCLNNCIEITDEGIGHLPARTNLEVLKLAGCPVTDTALNYIGTIKTLREINLSGCSITDNGLVHLQGLSGLRILRVSKHNDLDAPYGRPAKGGFGAITDTGLAYLSRLTQLEELELRGWPAIDNGLARLAGLTELKSLDLTGGSVTDSGLRHLAPLRKLEGLFLDGCPVTDRGLSKLVMNHPDLKALHLGSDGITDAGIGHLSRLTRLEELS